MLDTSNMQIIFPIVWWICLMIALDWGFLFVICFLFRSSQFWHILANLAKNLVPRSNTIRCGSGYQVNEFFLVIYAISAAFLLSICVISNQPVAGSIIVRHHYSSGFFLFRGIVYGPMRSTHSASQVFVSTCLCVSLPYLWLVVFALWHVGNFLHTLWTDVWRLFQ